MGFWDDFTDYAGSIGGTAGAAWGLMTKGTPPDDESVVMLDGIALPGVTQSVEVGQRNEWERVPIDGLSGSVKLFHGRQDADVRISLTLVNDEEVDGLVDVIGDALSLDLAAVFDSLVDGEATPPPTTSVQKLSQFQLFLNQYDKDLNPKMFVISQNQVNARGVVAVLFDGMDHYWSSNRDFVYVTLNFLEYQPGVIAIESGKAKPPTLPDAPGPLDTTSPFEAA